MKIQYLDGKEGDTDKMRDIVAMHLEAINECIPILKKMKLNYILVSLDEEGGTAGAVYTPDDPLKKLELINNLNNFLLKMFNGGARIVLWNDEKFDLLENALPKIIENLKEKDKNIPPKDNYE